VDTSLPAPDPAKSARQQLDELTTAGPPCQGCHTFLNPPGFAFEHFDGFGRYRATDRGLAIDASAQVVGPGDLAGTYADHRAFASALGKSDTVRNCIASKWFIYAHGRVPAERDECSLSATVTNFRSTGDVRELLLQMTGTPAFLYYRRAPEGAAP
jgi:hypothetical protein